MLRNRISNLSKRIEAEKSILNIIAKVNKLRTNKIVSLLDMCSQGNDFEGEVIHIYEEQLVFEICHIITENNIPLSFDESEGFSSFEKKMKYQLQADCELIEEYKNKQQYRKRNLIICSLVLLMTGFIFGVNIRKYIKDKKFELVRCEFEKSLVENVRQVLLEQSESFDIEIIPDFNLNYNDNGYYSCSDKIDVYVHVKSDFDTCSLQQKCQMAYNYYKALSSSDYYSKSVSESGYDYYTNKVGPFDNEYKGETLFLDHVDVTVYLKTEQYTYHYSTLSGVGSYFLIENNDDINDWKEYYGTRFPNINK